MKGPPVNRIVPLDPLRLATARADFGRPLVAGAPPIAELNDRAREIFRHLVEAYVETGEPVGSRTLTRRLTAQLSPATIRNVMADLQESGLLYAPHTSAGRVPTEAGLRLFVDGLLEFGALNEDDRGNIESRCAAIGRSVQEVMEQAGTLLSGLSRCASVVVAPKTDQSLKHIEFVPLGPGRALVVLVASNGTVENRVIELPLGLPVSALIEAGNYLNARLAGRTFEEARLAIELELRERRAELDALTQRVVEAGLATWSGEGGGALIVRGQARLLEDVTALGDLERIRGLFEALERGENFMRLLGAAGDAEGVRIFIGADNPLFANAGCSIVVAPLRGERQRIVGAIAVLGPARMNYARIIPLVDYTARVVGKLVG